MTERNEISLPAWPVRFPWFWVGLACLLFLFASWVHTRERPEIQVDFYWITGLLYGGIGGWLYIQRPHRKDVRLFYGLSLAVMLAFGLVGSNWVPAVAMQRIALCLCPGLLLQLISCFPVERGWAQGVRLTFHVPGLALLGWDVQNRWLGLVGWTGFHSVGSWRAVEQAAFLLNVVAGVVSIGVLLEGYWRVPDPRARRQAQWVGSSMVFALLVLVVDRLVGLFLRFPPLQGGMGILATGLAPFSFAAAVMEYRLLEIDVILRRSAVYALLALFLIGVLLAILILISPLLSMRGTPPTSLPAVIFLAVLLEVWLFEPARSRIEGVVCALFFRRQVMWQKSVGAAAQELKDLARIGGLVDLLTRKVPAQLGLERGWLVLFDPLEPGHVECHPPDGDDGPEPGGWRDAAVWVQRQGNGLREPLLLRDLPPERGAEEITPWLEAGVELCLPLVHHDDLVGLWLLGPIQGNPLYHSTEVNLLWALAREAAPAVANAVLYEELLDLAHRLEARVDERTRELTDLLSKISHALATPVTSISGFADFILASDHGLHASEVEHVRSIRHHALQLLSLGRNMRIVALLTAGRLHPRMEPVSLCEMINQAVKEMWREASAAGLRLEVNLPSEEVLVHADRDLLHLVVQALLQNACLYTPSGGMVQARVDCRPVGGPRCGDGLRVAEFAISDTGIGIPPEEQRQVFAPFFRGKGEGVRCRPGNGLGLTVAKGLVELQGGSIRCESQVGMGTTFTVTLPLAGSGKNSPHSPGLSQSEHGRCCEAS
ncbi:MAG: ATP-binding protein [Anaerolineae bacterium]